MYHAQTQIYIIESCTQSNILSVYKAYLEYVAFVWDGCIIQDFKSLVKLQNTAARIVIGINLSVSLDNLQKECMLAAFWRDKYLNCFLYKYRNNMIPDYISDLIPPLVREVSTDIHRNANDFYDF